MYVKMMRSAVYKSISEVLTVADTPFCKHYIANGGVLKDE